jgi:hypothetical protein
MPQPITIDLKDLQNKFNLAVDNIDKLTEICIKSVTAFIYNNWQAEARQKLHSTLPNYLNNLKVVDKGRFAKQIILSGVLPVMLETGADAFDMKEGFKNSPKAQHTVPVYNAKGKVIRKGGDWYLTIPYRQGTPGIVGQGGFANEMPQEIYDIMVHRAANDPLTKEEIPAPYDAPRSRAAIMDDKGNTLFAEYQHKSSIYEGLIKKSAAYNKVVQNTYVSFRRASENSDDDAWIHRGLKALNLAEEAIRKTDVNGIVQNEVMQYLNSIL